METIKTQHNDTDTQKNTVPTSKAKKSVKIAIWSAFFLFWLLLFSLVKLPDTRVRALIMTEINNALSQSGTHFSTQESWLSFGLGFTYKMRDSKLSFPAEGLMPYSEVSFEKIDVSPNLSKLLTGKLGGNIWFKSNAGKMDLSFAGKNLSTNPEISLDASLTDLDIFKLGIIKLLTSKPNGSSPMDALSDPSSIIRMLTGSLILDGGLDIQGSLSDLSTLNGDIDLDIEDLKLDSFSVMGFQIPKLKASKGRIQLTLDSGKGKLKKLFIGKSVKDGEDDLVIESEGEFKLGKSIHTSSLNLELKLKLSKAVLTQMSLLEVALKSALTPEGAYLYTVSGPMASPQFTAGPKQGSSGK